MPFSSQQNEWTWNPGQLSWEYVTPYLGSDYPPLIDSNHAFQNRFDNLTFAVSSVSTLSNNANDYYSYLQGNGFNSQGTHPTPGPAPLATPYLHVSYQLASGDLPPKYVPQAYYPASYGAGGEYVTGSVAPTGAQTNDLAHPQVGLVNDDFAAATVLTGASGASAFALVSSTQVAATYETGEPTLVGGNGSVWFSWTAPAAGVVSFDTIDTPLKPNGYQPDTFLAIYTGSSLTALTLVVSDDDSGAPAAQGYGAALATFTAISGTTYFIQVQSYDQGINNGVLTWTAGGRTVSTSTNTLTIALVPASGWPPLGVIASASVVTGTIVSYAWKMDQAVPSSTGTGATMSWIYTTSNSYAVTLTAVDSQGLTLTATAVVNVKFFDLPERLPNLTSGSTSGSRLTKQTILY